MVTICAPVLLVLACGVLLNTCSKSTDLVWAKRFKTEYYYKQDLDVSGGRLAKPSGDKIALVDATPKMVSGLSSDTIGESTLNNSQKKKKSAQQKCVGRKNICV